MGLKLNLNYTHKGVKLQNGHCYKFKYLNFQHDPYPHIFFLCSIKGTSRTGHKWDLIQAVNLNYIPRTKRKIFVKEWTDVLERSTNKKFHLRWPLIATKFPYMKLALRRYLLKPASLINRLEYIPPEKMEEEIIRNMKRDYSMAALRERGQRVRRFLRR